MQLVPHHIQEAPRNFFTYIECSVAFKLCARDCECDTILSINDAALQVPPPQLEDSSRNVFRSENAWIDMKSGANESWDLPGPVAPSFITFRAEVSKLWLVEGECM